MSAEDLTRLSAQVGFVVLFGIALLRAIRWPRPSNRNAAAFFGCVALLIVLQWIASLADRSGAPSVVDAEASLILLFPYLLLRLADDFLGVPKRVMRLAGASAVVAVTLVFAFGEPIPGVALLFIMGYFLSAQTYASVRFIRAARRARGLTQRRLRAVSLGTALLVMLVALAIPTAAFPDQAAVWGGLASLAGLGSGLAFFAGFALPDSLKTAWQSPEVRRLLDVGAVTRWLGDTPQEEFLDRVQADIASVLGAEPVIVWLWDDTAQRPTAPAPGAREDPTAEGVVAEVYRTGRPLIVPARSGGLSGAHLAVPVSLEGRAFGVISAFGVNAAAFAGDDLWLLEALARQVAFALEHRRLVVALGEARGREEANQLKGDFLSSAAHDLQTPLTTLLGEAQLMEQRALRAPEAPVDLDRTRRMIGEARRMRSLIRALLDSSRAEQGPLVGDLEPVDLAEVAREAVERARSRGHVLECRADSPAPVLGDRGRLIQLIENLVENAIKYSPEAGGVRVAVEVNDGSVSVAVSDEGIGIAPDDLPHLFERFWRSRSVDDRRFAGMGLGLYISRRIVEDHGGQIRAESTQGAGSMFTATVPALSADAWPQGRMEDTWATPTSW